MGELDYKKLRDLAREEKAQPGLVKLPDDFYSSVQEFLGSKFSDMESTRSVMQMREFENATAIIRELSLIRQQKILFKAIRSGGEHKGTEVMTREEHGLYDRFCAVIEEENNRMNSLLTRFESKRRETAPSGQAGEETRESIMLKKVRFTKDVLAFRGTNNETFGPYKTGDEGQLPSSEADWLLKGKLAEPIA